MYYHCFMDEHTEYQGQTVIHVSFNECSAVFFFKRAEILTRQKKVTTTIMSYLEQWNKHTGNLPPQESSLMFAHSHCRSRCWFRHPALNHGTPKKDRKSGTSITCGKVFMVVPRLCGQGMWFKSYNNNQRWLLSFTPTS